MKELGLRLNTKKSVLSPLQRTTFLGVARDLTSMQARLSLVRIEFIMSAVKSIRLGQSFTVKQFQRLLGLMAAASNVIPFGLLYMRPLQWWLRTKGFSLRGNPFLMIKVMRRCFRALVMWKKPWFLSKGHVLEASCCRKMLTTDASLTGWGAILEGCSSQGLWKDHHLSWHINRLEMFAALETTGVPARPVHCRASSVHSKGSCGGHKCLPHSFGWNVIGERPPGISFPSWYFEVLSSSFSECRPGKAQFLLPSALALDAYVHRAALWHKNEQLFICF